jgi:hypothetical protein
VVAAAGGSVGGKVGVLIGVAFAHAASSDITSISETIVKVDLDFIADPPVMKYIRNLVITETEMKFNQQKTEFSRTKL